MNTLRVYGEKNGTEKVIFAMLLESPASIKRAKQTAAQHGYRITKAIRHGTLEIGYREIDVTEKFFNN